MDDEGFCGDGFLDVDEECDDGEQNDDDGPCSTLCALTCGDGVLQESEECDQGPGNSNTGVCTKHCEQARCGDEFVQPGETCDDGDAKNSIEPGRCHPETCTLVLSSCGNGVLDEGEVCDPSAPGMDTVSCTQSCSLVSRALFASSETFSSDFGALDEADAACTQLADAADLEHSESFIAFLSTPQEPVSLRLGQFLGEYKDTNGKLIATGNMEFLSGTLKAPIGRDEYGFDATRNSTFAWTGSTHAGDSSEPSCNSWMSTELKVFGVVGSLMAKNSDWAYTSTTTCKDEAHLYCVEVNSE